MSIGTAISVGIQCLEALGDLHGIGYLHRDVKPGNYTIDWFELGEQEKVYIFDLGMCRKFTNDQGIIRKPRAGFHGTVHYVLIFCHMQRELCRKNDIETWVYMIIELTTGNLPWRNVHEMNIVGENERRCCVDPFLKELFNGCLHEYVEIFQCVDSLKYYDPPSYRFIYGKMRRAMTSMSAVEFPYDWGEMRNVERIEAVFD